MNGVILQPRVSGFAFELFTCFHLSTLTLVSTRKMQMTFHGFPYENLAKVVTFAALITAAEKGQLWQDAIALVDSSNVEGSGGCRVWAGGAGSAIEAQLQFVLRTLHCRHSARPNSWWCHYQRM